MCGRYVQRTPLQHVMDLFSALPEQDDFSIKPRFNIAPTQDVPVVRMDAKGQRRLGLLRWGLVPFWAKDPAMGNRMINARSETVGTTPAFRDSFRRRRCILPADGFYEWKTEGKRKQPYYIHRRDNQPIGFAGLWDRWQQGDQIIESCTILTTSPNDLLKPIHDRMPVILSPDSYAEWLDPKQKPEQLQSLLHPSSSKDFTAQAVSPKVNSPKNDDPSNIEEAAPADSQRPIDLP